MAERHEILISDFIIKHNKLIEYQSITGKLIKGIDVVIMLDKELNIEDTFIMLTGIRRIMYNLLFNDDFILFNRKVGKLIINHNGEEIYF
jgi:hypothetical protein